MALLLPNRLSRSSSPIYTGFPVLPGSNHWTFFVMYRNILYHAYR